MAAPPNVLPAWSWLAVLGGVALVAAGLMLPTSPGLALACFAGLIGAVFASVHHAEVVAQRVGQPFGTLVLAIAITVIEVGLIVSVMLAKGAGASTLARDTVFAVVMLVCNGIVGLCLVVGGVRHYAQGFQARAATGSLAVLGALIALTLVLPNYTLSVAGPIYSNGQLAFAGAASLVLYGTFVFVQTVRHPEDFIGDEGDVHGPRPGNGATQLASLLLVAALTAVVLLAKLLSPTLERAVAAAGAPQAVVGIVIAALVLLPEGITAVRAAAANRMQTSLNLSLGCALASIGLTIPAVAVVSIVLGQGLELGVGPKETTLLVLTLFTGVVTLGTGRTTLLQGVVHLVIAAAFLFLAVVP